MITIGFTFNDFDFTVHSFQFTSSDRVITVMKDSVTIFIEHLGKLMDLRVIDASSSFKHRFILL